MNVAMWGQALRAIPRLSKAEWDDLDLVARWLIATRAAVFVMTAVSCAVGGLLAWRDGVFAWDLFAACLVGLVFAHGTNNLLNDLTDHLKGVDKDNYFRTQYGPQPLEHGLMTRGQLLVYAGVTGAVALAAGGWLVYQTGTITLWLMAAGAFFVLFYTWPLKYIGLGEPAVILVWGPLMVGGTYHVVTAGGWSWGVVAVSLAYAIGPTCVLFGKHTDKRDQDAAKGIRTLPVLLGDAGSRGAVIAMLVVQLVLVAALVATGVLGLPVLLCLVAVKDLPRMVRTFSQPRPTERPDWFPAEAWPLYLSAHAFVYNRRFGILFVVGLLADAALVRAGVLG